MKEKRRTGYWIREERLFDRPVIRCSVCGAHAERPAPYCRRCGSRMKSIRTDPVWMEEMELDYDE